MKNFLKICAFCLLILSPPAQAQQHDGEMSGGQMLVGGGAISMLLGGLAWLASEQEACRAGFASHSGRCVSTNTQCASNPGAAVCTYTAKDEDQEKLGKNLVAGGAGAMVVGAIVIRADAEGAFQTRWRFHAADGVPKAVYPLSEKTRLSFGMSGKALNYDGVAVGLKYSF